MKKFQNNGMLKLYQREERKKKSARDFYIEIVLPRIGFDYAQKCYTAITKKKKELKCQPRFNG